MDFPTNPTPSQSLAMRRIGNEYANRAFAFGEPDPNMTRMRARPMAAGPSSIGVAPRPMTGLSPTHMAWAGGPPSLSLPPTPNVPMAGGAPRFVSQGGALMPAINGARRAMAPLARAAFGAPSMIASAIASAPDVVDFLGQQQAGYTPPAPPTPQEQSAYQGAAFGRYPSAMGTPPSAPPYSNEGRNYSDPQSTPLFDDHGHMTPAHPMAKQAMERPKVVAKQRQAAMERMMPYKDTRGAGMTMTSNVNGIREYEAPIDMSSIGVSAADPMDLGAYL